MKQPPREDANDLPLSPLYARPALELTQVGGAAVAAHYGDPSSEYRALRQGCGLLDRSWVGRLELAGPDCARFLHGLVTCEVKALEPGTGAYGFITNQQGQILCDVAVLRLEDRLWLELPPGLEAEVEGHLEKYRVIEQVELSRLATQVPLMLIGPHAEKLLAAAGALPRGDWLHELGQIGGHQVRVCRDPRLGMPAYGLWLDTDCASDVVEGLLEPQRTPAVVPVGLTAFDQLRVEAGMPLFGRDFHHGDFPQETGIEAAVSYTKGCYLGQEVVARIHYRGQVQRILRGLIFADLEPPPAGTALLHGGREAGIVGTSIHSPRLQQAVGLSILHRRAAEPGTRLTVAGGGEAEVAELPLEPVG